MNDKKDNSYVHLLQNVKKGDDTSFEQLMHLYEPMINTCIERYTPDWQNDDDAKQEALAGFFRAALSFDLNQPDVTFGLYAKICVTNALISHARKVMLRYDEEGLENLETDYTTVHDLYSDDPSKEIIDKENEYALRKFIRNNLSDYENTVWDMYTEGKGISEIACCMGKEEKSINNALYRIRLKLRSLIDKNGEYGTETRRK